MTERLDIKIAAAELGYTIRTFIKWCKRFGIEILSDPGFKARYVAKCEFIKVANKDSEEYIEMKYNCSIEEFKANMNVAVELRTAIDERKNSSLKKEVYHPKHEHELNALSRLTAILKNNNNSR